jgi:chloramphenicol O-acetyltransferase type B
VFDHAHFEPAIQDRTVELHQGDSSTLLGQLPDRHFDFIYIDGDHSYDGVVRDLAQAARKIKDDGWIVCNDYTLFSPLEKTKYGVYRAVNELCLQQGFEIVYLGLHKWGYHDVALRKAGIRSQTEAGTKPTATAPHQAHSPLRLDAGLTVEIGEHSYIHDRSVRNPSGALTHLRIGKFCSIATDLTIIGYDHHHEWITTYPFLDKGVRPSWSGTEGIPYPQASEFGSNKNRGDIIIGNDVWIGYDVKLFKGIEIGDGAVIGACSLVNKSVEPYTIVAGTPARPIRKRFNDAEIAALKRMGWWHWPKELINRYMPLLCSSRISELESQLEQDAEYAQFKAATANGDQRA